MEMGFKVKPKEKKDSINTAGCVSVILDFTDSIFLSLPLTHPRLQCVPTEGALSFTRTLIRTVSTANSTSLTSRLTNYISCVCYLLLFFNQKKKYLEQHSGGVVKSLPSVLFCILNDYPSSEKFPFVSPLHSLRLPFSKTEVLNDKHARTKCYS